MPALPLAVWFDRSHWVLIEAMQKRAGFLREAITALGLAARVTVEERRAEEVGRDPAFRGAFDLVTARSFGPPAVTAECAAPLLAVGGRLVVSEPPGGGGRWAGGHELGFSPAVRAGAYAVLTLSRPPGERYPRRTGIPTKRPLW